MVNLFEKLKYKSGKSITTSLKKAERLDLLELKPYEKLDYKQALDILEVIETYLPKTKKNLASTLMRNYKRNIEKGIFSPNQVPPKKEIQAPKDLDYTDKSKMFSLKEELLLLGYDNKEDLSEIYIRFLRKLKRDKIYSAMRKFIEEKLSLQKDRSEYFKHKATFVDIVSQYEEVDLVHIDEFIFLYEFFKDYSFALNYAFERLSFWKDKRG